MTSRGHGQSSPTCPGSHISSPGNSGLTPRGEECLRQRWQAEPGQKIRAWDLKGAQGDVENIGLPGHPDKTSIGVQQMLFLYTSPLSLPGKGGVRRESFPRGFLLCPSCHQHLPDVVLSLLHAALQVGFFLFQFFNFFLCYFLFL